MTISFVTQQGAVNLLHSEYTSQRQRVKAGRQTMTSRTFEQPILHELFMPGYALDDMLTRDVEHVLHGLRGVTPTIVTEADLAGLPAPVQRYLQKSGIVGKQSTLFARMRFQGEFRRGPEHKWMPMISEQYNRIDQPARLWYAMMKFMPLVNFFVRDAYNSGEGTMYAKLTPWYTMFDEHGPGLTQGELLVALNDMVFFPSAFLSANVTWESLDDRSARAYLATPDKTVSGVFYFDSQDDVVDFVGKRYSMSDKAYLMWSTPFAGHQEIDGIRIPTEGSAMWHTRGDSNSYVRVSLVSVDRNICSRYP
jgi:hypothetical protein